MLQFGAPLGIFGHLAFLVTFWLFDYHVLALFNVFSVAVFSYGCWRIFKGDLVALTYPAMVIEIPLVNRHCPLHHRGHHRDKGAPARTEACPFSPNTRIAVSPTRAICPFIVSDFAMITVWSM